MCPGFWVHIIFGYCFFYTVRKTLKGDFTRLHLIEKEHPHTADAQMNTENRADFLDEEPATLT